ncbi:transcriptional regulator CynR [Salmonella enterica subsp. enterica serovar Choleraesuis]|nr:transcriptional regulator CynR [Salmonella enterica subsp. enterica serovar Choleraesuis]
MLLRYIRYFLAVAEHENFTRAAEALSISQPTLSQQIRQLEEMVGAPLFERSARKVGLTDAGELWAEHARRITQEIDDGMRAIKDVSDLQAGSLAVALTPTFSSWLLAPLIQAFRQRWPGISLSINVMNHAAIERKLINHELDIGVAFGPYDSPEITASPVFEEQVALMVGPTHPWFSLNAEVSVRQCQELSLVMLNNEFATRQHANAYFRNNGVVPDVAIETNSISALSAIIASQPLATLLPAQAASHNPGLHIVNLTPPVPNRQVVLLERRDSWRSAASQAFCQLITEFAHNYGASPVYQTESRSF